MALENTPTEEDLDAGAHPFVEALCREIGDVEPDLAVDGLSDSILSKFIGLFRNSR